jgi:hypothetical protein
MAVTMLRAPLRNSLVLGILALLMSSCAREVPFETAASLPEPGRPAGATTDLSLELPPPQRTGGTRDGVVVLFAPLDPDLGLAVVEEFFRAVADESLEALVPLFHEEAVVQVNAQRQAAIPHFRGRFEMLDYSTLGGEAIYRAEDVTIFGPDGADSRKDARPTPFEPRAGELVIRVVVARGAPGRKRLFGDELAFRLRAVTSGYVIVEILESVRQP